MSNLKYAFHRGEGWNVVGLRGKALVAGGHRGGFCEKDLEAAPCLGRAPLFSKSEPISDVVLRLCESIFKTGKKLLRHTAAGRVKGVRNSLAGAKVSVEGGGEVLQAPEQKSPVACGEDHGEAGCPPAAHGVPRWSRVPRCSPWRRPRWSRWPCTDGGCRLWKTPAGADSGPDL